VLGPAVADGCIENRPEPGVFAHADVEAIDQAGEASLVKGTGVETV
jgi:hypothetical protein